ncbi:MAG: hypothetical protein C0399_03520 [Syntrophus sp. (in: bacteria)]|nr:hypothetical protein [Syntrophus sp. (in: bacteria)]
MEKMNDEMFKMMKRIFKSEEKLLKLAMSIRKLPDDVRKKVEKILGGPMDDKDLDKMITEFEESKRRFEEVLKS